MSFITFTFRCPSCKHTEEDKLVRRTEMDDQPCPRCNDTLVRLPAGTRTHFRFADSKLKG